LLLYQLSRFYEHINEKITTKLDFAEWSSVFGETKMTTVLPDRLMHHCHVVEINESHPKCQIKSEGLDADLRHAGRGTVRRLRRW
jgi:DNA replication protein DnaC